MLSVRNMIYYAYNDKVTLQFGTKRILFYSYNAVSDLNGLFYINTNNEITICTIIEPAL